MLNIALETRKNELIIDVMQEALHKRNIESNSNTDQTDSSLQPNCSPDVFQNSVMILTLNDDPESLKAVLQWGGNNVQLSIENALEVGENINKQRKGANCPILVASLQNFTQCMKELYKFGYRIGLPDEDKKAIEKVLNMKHALTSDLHFYFSLKSKNADEIEDLSETFGCATSGKSTFFTGPIKEKVIKVSKDSLVFDPVERFLRFKACADPGYLSVDFIENGKKLRNGEADLRLLDPIRKSFALAQYSKHLSSYFVQHSEEYKEIREKCHKFTEDILEQCGNAKEVATILEYSPNEDDDENNENTNWHLALWEDHKNFVGNHYFQHFLWEKITGENFNWDNYFLFWRIFYLPIAVILFCFIPLVAVVDSIFRDSDILFVSPEMMKKKRKEKNKSGHTMEFQQMDDEEKANCSMYPIVNEAELQEGESREAPVFSFFRERIHRPIFRMIVSHFLEVIFLINLGLSMYDPYDIAGKSDFWPYDIITIIFVINYFIEDIIDMFRRKLTFFSSFWSFFSFINHLFFVLGGALSYHGFQTLKDDCRSNESGNHPVNVGSTLLSLGTSMAFFRVVRWFLLQRTLGPVVVCVIKVLKDVLHICFLFAIIFVSFAIGTFSMFKPFRMTEVDSFKIKDKALTHEKSLFSGMFWRLFDPGEAELASIVHAKDQGDNIAGERSLQFSHFVGIAFWAIYQATIVILLINILIAMMNTTYTKVSQHADLHWKYSKSYYQVQFLAPRAVLPPPFRIFYYFAKLMRFLKTNYSCIRKCSIVDTKPKCAKQDEKEKKREEYLNLLLKLVETKLHSDAAHSAEDNMDDLRKDIQNIVSDKQKSVHDEMIELKNLIKNLSKEIKSLKTQNLSMNQTKENESDALEPKSKS